MHAVEAAFHAGYPADAAAVLLVEIAGFEEDCRRMLKRLLSRLSCEHGARSCQNARNKAERDALWAGRKGAAGATGRIAPNYYMQDVCVPRSKLASSDTARSEVASRANRISRSETSSTPATAIFIRC